MQCYATAASILLVGFLSEGYVIEIAVAMLIVPTYVETELVAE